jgi:cell division protein FtsB
MAAKQKTPQKKISIRAVLISLLGVLIVALTGYKYYEWSTLHELQQTFVKTQFDEMTQDQDNERLNKEITHIIRALKPESATSSSSFTKSSTEVNSKLEIYNGFIKAEIELLKSNRQKYAALSAKSKYLFGQRGQYVSDIETNMSRYYDKLIQAEEDAMVQSYLLQNILPIWADTLKIGEFRLKTTKNPKIEIPKYASDVRDFAKYTRSDFTFREEAKMKDMYPKVYTYLINNKKLLAGFYQLVNDYTAGDMESVAYNAKSLDELAKIVDEDTTVVFEENKDKRKDRAEEILKHALKAIESIKSIQTENLNTYPVTARLNKWNEDVTLCKMYDLKISIFKEDTNNLPKATTVDDLLAELSTIPPKTDHLDKIIDKNNIKYAVNQETVTLSCTDPLHNKIFMYDIPKDKN